MSPQSEVPIGLNSPVGISTIYCILDVKKDTPNVWSTRGVLPTHHGVFMGHRYWTAKEIIRWADDNGRAALVRPEWRELIPGEIVQGYGDSDSWNG